MKVDVSTLFRSALVGLLLVATPLATGALLAQNSPLISLGQSRASAPLGAEQSSDSKMMMPNPFSYVYLPGDNLPTGTGTGHVYQLQLIGEPNQILETVAKLMKMDGPVSEAQYSTKEYPSYVIGPQDGSAPSVSISFTGTGNWWYNNPAAFPIPECSEWASADDGSKYCAAYEEQKLTPQLIPSKAEMIRIAKRIFAATGLSVADDEIQTSSFDWGSSAYASLKVGGQSSPIEWSINWGSNGEIGSISGHSVEAVDRGKFETISPKDAVSRISDWRYSGQLAQSEWLKYQTDAGRVIAYDDIAVEPGDSVSSSEPESKPSPSTINVTINKFETAQVMIWDKQGRAWIVPGYILIGDQNSITPIFSLKEGIVELPEPVEISPLVK